MREVCGARSHDRLSLRLELDYGFGDDASSQHEVMSVIGRYSLDDHIVEPKFTSQSLFLVETMYNYAFQNSLKYIIHESRKPQRSNPKFLLPRQWLPCTFYNTLELFSHKRDGASFKSTTTFFLACTYLS